MDLLYKSSHVDIFFDRKSNLLVQKWKNKETNMELIYGPKNDKGVAYILNEIATTQLYNCPTQDLEAELQIILFQFFPGLMPKA
jgi:hypothetical protein